MSIATVYVVNEPLARDRDGTLSRMYDLSSARRFGTLKHLFSAGKLPEDPDFITDKLREGLHEFTASDYLILIGDLVAVSCAVGIAAERTGGVVNCLRWQNRAREYQPTRICLTAKETCT